MIDIFFAILCVIGISIGQILFKVSANGFHKAGSFTDPTALGVLLVALALYGVTTIGWVWVLQRSELGRVYPFMALAFAIVPLLSYIFLHENFTWQYAVGVFLIISGILVSIGQKL
ncbi:DMT family transporter [Acetobacter cibinongensis]|uniref:Uncharacterized protein n=1 Tax=Acetobacter cibinongensis TaxID=146475 RepID=A0A1Z5YV03_9PROT|nr:EamA family transporter [Acetobacter cibinongensis]OUJ02425.1 hypothetical protein HK14_06130 [Acetobacter cibinongensis]GAN59975.1 hypothetical protein Abci_008_108 [Acetobacter cibinongensis]GBQ16463.1 hypothetical protein AA0482_1572 [Acetobacter cibinongensis NRIC 0482]GEL57595.1 hypothetical protein ACI01nite_01970 [Acetobacter cibinongensis]